MAATGYKIIDLNNNYIDISGVFSTKFTSAATVASANPYKSGGTTNVLNQFELYSSTGLGHPLQSNLIGYKINNIDITKYYTPIYNNITGEVSQTINIPAWVKKVAFIIQSKGGNNGTSAISPATLYKSNAYTVVATPGNDPVVEWPGGAFGPGAWSAAYYFVKTTNAVTANASAGWPRHGKLYKKGVTYSGGAGSGGTCYVGAYTINTSNKATAVTYVSNTGTIGYLQFNEPTNSNRVTVPNGNNGGNATTSANGTAASASSAATLSGTPSYITGTSYSGTTVNSGFALNPSITTSHPIPTGVSFTNKGGPGAKEAQIIYWFLI